MIPRAAVDLVQNNQIETILGLFQRLISTKTNEMYGFELLECIVGHIPPYDVYPDIRSNDADSQ